MSTVLKLHSIEDTTLWKRLHDGFVSTSQKDIATDLAVFVKRACASAEERIKRFPYYHPEFTLHDECHMLRVTELMARILGDDIEKLNAIEVSLLILSAFYHDQGMVPDADEWESIKGSPEFRLSLERWNQEHPNVRDIRRQSEDGRFSDLERNALSEKLQQHLDAHRTSFLRVTHGERAEQLVNLLYGSDAGLAVARTNLAPLLGRLCASHVWPASKLTDENGFRVDHAVGSLTINLRFLALLLRLADILDFDRDRTPEALLRTINISSSVSLVEWAKHGSVQGWEISNKRIRFTLACEHPAYQKAAYEFMDAIDHELRESHRIVADFPRGTPTHYQMNLPLQVERDRIEPKNNAYRYADLEFSLSRDEIVKLLMTDKLYSNNSLFVRELIQNSLDALRHRVAVHGKGKPDWEGGLISLAHFIDSNGNQVVQCVDNGIGMDEQLVRSFLTKVGRSYYRSPEFAQQRIGFRENRVDFDPCAQFGIGFMSCFMFGDRIAIKTRKDYGPGRGYGEPLEIEVNGLGGLLVIRDGKHDQPVGTTIEVTGPRPPVFLDDWADDVQLCTVVNGYALATEFSIVVRTLIEEIAKEVKIPTEPAFRRTAVEDLGVQQSKILEFSLKETDYRLGGTIRIGLLVDDDGLPCIENKEARWELKESKVGQDLYLTTEKNSVRYFGPRKETATCMDGILICGQPGREDDDEREAWKLGWRGNVLDIGDPFLIDIRGELKPIITPSRIPPERLGGSRRDRTWTRVEALLRQSHAKAWTPVLDAIQQGLTHQDFWRLSLIHRIPIHLMPADLLWKLVHVPTVLNDDDANSDWVALSQLNNVEACKYGEKNSRRAFKTADGRRIGFGKDVEPWYERGYRESDAKLLDLLLRFARIGIHGNKVSFSIGSLDLAGVEDTELGLSDGPGSYLFTLAYVGDASELLSAQCEFPNVNRHHPLVRYVRQFQDLPYRELTDFQKYCASVLWELADDEGMSALATKDVKKGRQYRRLGVIFKSIDWSRYDLSLAPPYRVWTVDSGIVEITKDDLVRWGEL